MRATNSLARWCWAALALGALGLQAQDSGVSAAFKFRGLLSSTAKDQGMTNGVFGHGIELGYGCGLEVGFTAGPGRVISELGYSVATGDAILKNVSTIPTSGSDTSITPDNSFESRKNKIEGITLRLGYEAPLSSEISWRAGLQFGGTKFTHQVVGNLNGTSGEGTFSDSYWFVGSKNALAPSPYAGLTYNLDKASALEVGVLLLQYTALDYRHVANAQNELDTVGEKKRIVPNFEIAYVFRF